jgi:protein disulfide-isomerase
MPRIWHSTFGLFLAATIASVSFAQEGIRWQQDIEAAKATAKQTNRLVLVHVWGDGCGPCKALEHNVFNQPGVAGAIEQQFVPVKINANEYPATAQGFGITRIPTDVIITPEGKTIGKMISPATPSAYVAELSQVAGKYRTQSGHAYQLASEAASQPMGLQPAYANLNTGSAVAVQTPPALPPTSGDARYVQPSPTSIPLTAQPAGQYGSAANLPGLPTTATAATNPLVGDRYAMAPPAGVQPPIAATPATNPYVAGPAPGSSPLISQPLTGYDEPKTDRMAPPALAVPAITHGGPAQAPAQPSTTETKSTPPAQLPSGSPPLGFDGFCPVSMRTAWKWVPGDAKFGAIHRGRTYLFAGPQEQQQFLANPDHYAPALAGIDPVMAIDHKQSVPGLREHSLDYDSQFFLFSSEATLQQFTANPKRYVIGVHQAMGMHSGPVR